MKVSTYLSASSILPAIVAALFSTQASATDWQRVGKTTDGEIIYIDVDTIVREGSRVLAWSKWDYRGIPLTAKRQYTSEKDRHEFDCSQKRSRLREAIEYSAAGNVMRSFHWEEGESTWSSAVPDSIGETEINYVCSDRSTPPPG